MTRPVKPMSFIRQPLDAIFSGVGSVRVLRALIGHGGALSVSRLAMDTRLSGEGVRGVLAELQNAGVIHALGSGRTWLYQATADHPIVAALQMVFTAEDVRFNTIIESVKSASADSRIVAAWLFGSVARHEDRVGSDLDIAIILDAPDSEIQDIADRVRDALVEPGDRLGFIPSVIKMTLQDVARHSAEGSILWGNLLKDAVILKGKDPKQVAKLPGTRK